MTEVDAGQPANEEKVASMVISVCFARKELWIGNKMRIEIIRRPNDSGADRIRHRNPLQARAYAVAQDIQLA